MKRLFNNMVLIGIVFCFVKYFIFTAFTILALIILFIVVLIISNWKYIKQARQFHQKYEGKFILWLGSNKRYQTIIQNHLLKLFDFEHINIQNQRNEIISNFSQTELRFFQVKTFKQKLPVLFTVKNKKLESISFFEEIYQLKNKQISLEEFETCVKTKLKTINHE